MDMDMPVLSHETSGHFELIPLLDTLQVQHTHLNVSTVLNQHGTYEEEGGNGGVYPQPIFRIGIEAFPDGP